MELLLIENMYEIPISLLIRNNSFSFNNENFIRGYHVYTKIRNPRHGECLSGKKEPSNGVAVIRLHSCDREEVVGHVPQNISKVVSLCLSLPTSLSLSATFLPGT